MDKQKNKKKALEPSKQRQMKILKEDFPYDEDSHTFTISLHHDSVLDLLDEDLSTPEHPSVSWNCLERLSDVVEDLPAGENADIRYCVDDYKGYEPAKLVSAFNRSFSKNRFLNQRDRKKKGIAAITMVLVGLLLLFAMVAGKANGWFGEEGSVTNELLVEVIDIAGWVFIWEAVSVLFLSPSEYRSINVRILFTVSRISFYDGKGEKRLSGEEIDEDLKLIGRAYNHQQRGKIAVLIAGAAFLASGFFSTYSLFLVLGEMIQKGGYTPGDYALAVTLPLFIIALTFFAGVSGILFYLDRPFGKKASFFVSVALFALLLSDLILGILSGDLKSIVQNVFAFLIQILYVVGYFYASVPDWVERRHGKKNQEK